MTDTGSSMESPQRREEALLTAALGKLMQQRAAFLDEACQGDVALRRRLETLLAAHEQSDSAPPTVPNTDRATVKIDHAPDIRQETIGQHIGRYKLLEKIGEGGYGTVYVAEQSEPIRRRVALKVIKLGMDTREVVARFEAERQALARMDHPNIARVFDAGATESGRPYFVMELVRGVPITDYCDQNRISTLDRLGLFIEVCHAVQHAHQKGVIHRDLKPSNILVTMQDGAPVPKVIDFGIAKAIEGRLTEATVYTQLHQFVGTPAYMSPEQAEMSGLDVDTRSDIYSLGVLLYELLVGRTPLDAEALLALGLDAMRRAIREQEPPRPSTRLSALKGEELTTTAGRRSVAPAKLVHLLSGDLDWIVMRCLEKDRTRRYATAEELAMDLGRHLEHEPVVARPPSRLYRFGRLARRNKLAFSAAAATAVALALGGVASAWLAIQATQAQHEAETTAAREAKLRQAAVTREARLRLQAESYEALAQARSLFAGGEIAEVDKIMRSMPGEFIEHNVASAAPILRALGHWHGGANRWQESAAHYDMLLFGPARQSVELFRDIPFPPTEVTMTLTPLPAELAYLEYAPLLIELGDLDGYERLRDSAVERFSETKPGYSADPVLHACLLAPPDARHMEALHTWASTTARFEEKAHVHWSALALYEYRCGSHETALAGAERCLRLAAYPAFASRARVLAAMAHARLGRPEEARAQLDQCREMIESRFRGEVGVGLYATSLWAEWLTNRVLLREADALVASPAAASGAVTVIRQGHVLHGATAPEGAQSGVSPKASGRDD